MIGVFVPWNDARPDGAGWVIDGNGCHIWMGSSARGYGTYGSKYVHRLRYEREIGPIPDGMQLDHFVCDNGAGGCCNPRHCRPVTPRENVLRSEAQSSLNAAKTHCPKGHPLEGENLCGFGLRRGQRKCRTCYRDMDRARAQRRRASAKSNGGYLYR